VFVERAKVFCLAADGRLHDVYVFGISNWRHQGFIAFDDIRGCGKECNEGSDFGARQCKALHKPGIVENPFDLFEQRT
jgi:hypothetical protein